MTTRPEPNLAVLRRRPSVSALEWKLLVMSLLSLVYAASWWRFSASAAKEPVSSPASEVAVSPRWLDQVPASQRPVVTLPAGWTLGSARGDAPKLAAPRVVRAAPQRRLRTRSS